MTSANGSVKTYSKITIIRQQHSQITKKIFKNAYSLNAYSSLAPVAVAMDDVIFSVYSTNLYRSTHQHTKSRVFATMGSLQSSIIEKLCSYVFRDLPEQ